LKIHANELLIGMSQIRGGGMAFKIQAKHNYDDDKNCKNSSIACAAAIQHNN
jgi:hypothetical protein